MKIHFNGLNDGRAAVLDDSLEPYFALLGPDEISEKTGEPIAAGSQLELEAECLRRFTAAVMEFTPQEKEALHWHVERIHVILEQSYPGLASVPWSFVKLASRIEFGYPHTRGAHIMLSEGTAKLAVLRWEKRDHVIMEFMLPSFYLLAHEQFHVIQRLHPEPFLELYTHVWGFEHAKRIEFCPWITERRIVNPDATDMRWIFPVQCADKKRWVCPFITMADGNGTGRRSLKIIAVEVQQAAGSFQPRMRPDGTPYRFDPRRLKGFAGTFPRFTFRYDHPHEISADIFGCLIKDDIESTPGRAQEADPGLRSMKAWFRQNLIFAG